MSCLFVFTDEVKKGLRSLLINKTPLQIIIVAEFYLFDLISLYHRFFASQVNGFISPFS